MQDAIITVILAVLSAGVSILSYYLYIRRQIENHAIDAINKAEELEQAGKEKMKAAVESIYAIIPIVARPFVSKEFIENVIQSIFDKVEDYASKQK